MDKLTDRDLVERYLARRDERSFRQLYDRHTPALYGMAIRLSGNETDAQDRVQETWIRACSRVERFRWESALRTWLTGILINCVREQYRRRFDLESEAADVDILAAPIADGSNVASLNDALARLPDGYRHVLVLHDVEGYTHEEIAALLGIAEGTSKSQLHHARRALRDVYFAKQ
jgi:RNA polymerase sigma-70 factor (ECF subfamily)